MTTMTLNTTNDILIEIIKAFVSKDPKGTTFLRGEELENVSNTHIPQENKGISLSGEKLEETEKKEFDIMDYAGIIKDDIPDNIKEMKLNDKEYLARGFGVEIWKNIYW